jgi:uncharacterized protein (TIGR02145 family)
MGNKMKTLISCLLLMFIYSIVSFAQNSPNDSTGTVTDIDGNVYQTVKIGDQWWMAENLKVTSYQNGDSIAPVTDSTEWIGLTSGAWCVYDNQDSNKVIYGLMYNWYAVDDSRSIAPEGWHVPTDGEWQILVDYLGGDSLAGGKIRSTGTIEGGDGLWTSPNADEGATNESGFSALPGGYRTSDLGTFNSVGRMAFFWSSTESHISHAFLRYLRASGSYVFSYYFHKRSGFSVRCVRDSVATIIESSALQPINSPNLIQNYPNPFNPSTTIEFTISKTVFVTLKIYNLLGQEIETLISKQHNAGSYTFEWDATGHSSGIYMYSIEAGDYREVKKMLLLK